MEVAGLSLAVPPLLAECAKLVKACHDVQTKYRSAPDTLAAVITECNAVASILNDVQHLGIQDLSFLAADRQNLFRANVEGVTLGCTNALSTIEQRLQAYRESADSDGVIVGPLRRLGRRQKMRAVWDETEIVSLLQRLRGYQINLTLSLSLLHVQADNGTRQLIEMQGTVLTALLQRSRSIGTNGPAFRQSIRNEARHSVETARNSVISDTSFAFDNEALNSNIYREAFRRRVKQLGGPLPHQQLDNASSTQAVASLLDDQSEYYSVLEHLADLATEAASVITDNQSAYYSLSGESIVDHILPSTFENIPSLREAELLPGPTIVSPAEDQRSQDLDVPVDTLFTSLSTETSHILSAVSSTSQDPSPISESRDQCDVQEKSSHNPYKPVSGGAEIVTTTGQVARSAIQSNLTVIGEHSSVRETVESSPMMSGALPDPIPRTDQTTNSTRARTSLIKSRIRGPFTGPDQVLCLADRVDFNLFHAKSEEAPIDLALDGPSLRSQDHAKAVSIANSVGTMKCVLVGDPATLKTHLLLGYTHKPQWDGYVPMVYPYYAVTITVSDQPWALGLFDTAGQEDYDRLRPLSYPDSDVLLICAKIGIRAQYESARTKWVPEIKHFCPGVPFILVGVKPHPDHCYDFDEPSVDVEADLEYGERIAKDIGALLYLECDLGTIEGPKNIFDEAIAAVLESRLRSKRRRKRRLWRLGGLRPVAESNGE